MAAARRIISATLVSALTMAACTSGPGSVDQTQAPSDAAAPSGLPSSEASSSAEAVGISVASTSAPFDLLHIDGVPYSGDIDALDVVMTVDGEEYYLPVFDALTDPHISVPLATETPFEEWTLDLDILLDGEVVEEVAVTVAALERAPGAWGSLVEEFEGWIDRSAAMAGSSYHELSAMDRDDVPVDLLGLQFAIGIVSDPEYGLRAHYDELPSDEQEALDAMAAQLDLMDLVSGSFDPTVPDEFVAAAPAMIGGMDDVLAAPGVSAASAASGVAAVAVGPDCVANTLEIDTDEDLSRLMAQGREAVSENRAGGPVEKVERQILTPYLTGGGWLPGWLGTGFNLTNVVFVTYLAARHRRAGVYPTQLDGLEVAVTETEFREDFTTPGTWSQAKVSASSTGWARSDDVAAITAAALAAVASHAGGAASTRLREEGVGRIHPGSEEFFHEVFQHLDDVPALAYVGGNGVATAITELAPWLGGDVADDICPREWTVDVRDEWIKPSAVFGRFDVAARPTFTPGLTGPNAPFDDVLKLEADSAFFAGRTAHQHTPVSVSAIDLDPGDLSVVVDNAGDAVAVSVTVVDANDDSVAYSIDPGAGGGWGAGSSSGSVHTNTLTTSSDPDAYPYRAYVTSTASTGLRADGQPPRRVAVRVRLRSFELFAEPNPIDVTEPSLLYALDDDDRPVEVSWHADGGTVTPAGLGLARFDAEEPGRYLITATDVDGEEETIVIVVTDGECTYRFTIAGTTYYAREGDVITWSNSSDGESRLLMSDVGSDEQHVQMTFTTDDSMRSQNGVHVGGVGSYFIRFATFEIDGQDRGSSVFGSGDVDITDYEDGVLVAGGGAGSVLSPDGGYSADRVPFTFEFVIQDDGVNTNIPEGFACYVGEVLPTADAGDDSDPGGPDPDASPTPFPNS